MTLSKYYLFGILLSTLIFFSPFLLVQAQDKLGFISIDCGLSDTPSYTDATTGISYVSDSNFTEYGENRAVSPTNKALTSEKQFWNLRSFPEGSKNCYTLRPSQGKGIRYLIRARFMYGNYDNENNPPSFDLYIGVDRWDTVRIETSNTITNKEIMHTPLSDYVQICLVNTDYGVPFISLLELRPIGNEIYKSKNGSALRVVDRYDVSATSSQYMRYIDDVYDRFWRPLPWTPFIDAPVSAENSIIKSYYGIPKAVMGTAYTGNITTRNLNFHWDNMSTSTTYFMYLHFAELEILGTNQSREFNIFLNGDSWTDDSIIPRYLKEDSLYSTRGFSTDIIGKIDVWLNSTNTSTLPALLNAAELCELVELSGQHTDQTDMNAILGVKSTYGLERIKWQGDPCGPEGHIWDGLDCSYTTNNFSRIVSLNLSSSGLKGDITPFIANLNMLTHLDLSNNTLTGTVPEFLVHLSFLQVLNLKGNNFTSFPDELLTKKGLQFSIDTNIGATPPCSSGSCGKKKKNIVVPLVASFGGVFFLVLIVVSVILIRKKRMPAHQVVSNTRDVNEVEKPRKETHEDTLSAKKQQQFTYSEILEITNNNQRVLGEGGFGKVYYGFLDGKEVAVKTLSSSSIQGHRQFHAELKLLLRVHHKNLTTLVGYCNEPNNIGLIYEYMAMGNLRSHLSEGKRTVLTWEDRLRIAIDTAQGLEYLHNGCKPPIVHRDVKSTNILLNEKFQAKLGDFGLSKDFPQEVGNHISNPGIAASIAGTPGYLDPEYYITNWLNEKSDVYSFGIVLLELITARPVIIKSRGNSHIIQWVSSMLATGDIKSILDPRLGEDCDLNTVWKAIEISMACVSRTSSNRPTMSRVTTELKDCLVSELARRNRRDTSYSSNDCSSVEMVSSFTISEFSPLAR